jgi:hypothetical protein
MSPKFDCLRHIIEQFKNQCDEKNSFYNAFSRDDNPDERSN